MFEINKIKQGISLQEVEEIVDKILLILQLMYDSELDDKTTDLLMNELLPKFVEPAYLYDLQAASMRFLEKLGISIEDFYVNDGQPASVAILKEEKTFREFFNLLYQVIWTGLIDAKLGKKGIKNKKPGLETIYSKLTNIARYLLSKNFMAFSIIHNGLINDTIPREDISTYYKCVNNTFRTFPQFIGYSDDMSAFLSTIYGGRMYNSFMSDLSNAYSRFYGSDTGKILNFTHELLKLIQSQPLTVFTNVSNNKHGLPILTIYATRRKRLELKPSILSRFIISEVPPRNMISAIDEDWALLNSDLIIGYRSNTNSEAQAVLHQIAIKYIIKGRIKLYERLYHLAQKKYKTEEKYDLMLKLLLTINSLQNMSGAMVEPAIKYQISSKGTSENARQKSKKVTVRTIH